MTAKKRILFVDDEPAILDGLENLLYKDRKRWEMVFASGGQAALDAHHKQPFDVVVSDMRMPHLDGADLLAAIKEECPQTVRIMLSGHANRETIVRALPALHQLISKPCNAGTLRSVLERSLEGVDVERDARIRHIIGGVDKLPTPSDIYFELTCLMQSRTSSVDDLARVVSRDPALCAKLLQLINSPYFGAGRTTTSIPQAVGRLGIDQLRYIALTTSVFSPQIPEDAYWFSLQDLQRASMRAAWIARALADPASRDDAFAATLLHDIGHIVIALSRGAEFEALRDRARREPERVLELERELLGVTHADVGARLLAIWGLPPAIVDVVQFHHDPGGAPASCRSLASIVHVADSSVQHLPAPTLVDLGSLERAGCAHLLPGWLAIAERVEPPPT
jgi:HD-like signal output (HDOD) protein/CheY-like chemotaxis protein